MHTIIEPLKLIDDFQQEVPVRVFDLVKAFGLEFEQRPMDEDISGAIERVAPDRYRVVVNSKHSITRQRFTAGHEIGHYIYHRDLLGRGVGDTLAFRAAGSNCPNPAIQPVHERQANSFAANLLMPRHLIDRLRTEGHTDYRAMAGRLGVSDEAMRIRLGLPKA